MSKRPLDGSRGQPTTAGVNKKATQQSDLANEGGTAPGGVVPFMGAASQWASTNRIDFPDPVKAAKMQHYGLADEAPSQKGDVPVHPGLAPGLFRTARDANYDAPDGETNVNKNPNETGGHPLSASGRSRGESPEIEKQTRGSYRP